MLTRFKQAFVAPFFLTAGILEAQSEVQVLPASVPVHSFLPQAPVFRSPLIIPFSENPEPKNMLINRRDRNELLDRRPDKVREIEEQQKKTEALERDDSLDVKAPYEREREEEDSPNDFNGIAVQSLNPSAFAPDRPDSREMIDRSEHPDFIVRFGDKRDDDEKDKPESRGG